MESVWLDGRSADGTDWTWVSSGFTLPSMKSNVTSYPPWSEGHPISLPGNDDLYQRGRCLILDRHLCAEYTTPVFLDLDCERKRPFVCQDDIQQQATNLAERIRKLAKDEQSGLLFVMDDSLSVLNAWFAEEMKLAATIIRRYFPLSRNHPMGMITFSQKSKVVLALNQTDTCNVLGTLSQEMLANRATRVKEDLDGVAGKTTNLINAALMSVDTVRASNMQRVIVVFVTDGEHVTEDKDKKNLRTAVESLQNLRNGGHEAFAIVISQGQKHADYNVIEELFSTSLKGEQNLYFVENYEGLAEMNSALNSTELKEDYAAQCKFCS
ncbi:hypothetical protein X777_13247 [Ooceraea biroi]|uniref:VWFA domain-containing protein n=1 Tax=Ooceraea biroi TaxID=2015173 RepID=A0A026VYP6_OOCBI|nr:hypothetical protein X777_13247 [Ooceraea biroi]